MGTEQNNERRSSKNLPKGVRDAVLNEVAELYLKGYSYRYIKKQVEETQKQIISVTTVGKMVKSVLEEWRTYRIEKLDDLKTVELSRISKLENTYWEGWERSLEGFKKTSEKQKAAPRMAVGVGGAQTETMKVVTGEKSTFTEETYGDPRFLAGIQWCISMRCKILGIEAPVQFEGKFTGQMKNTTVFKTRIRTRPE